MRKKKFICAITWDDDELNPPLIKLDKTFMHVGKLIRNTYVKMIVKMPALKNTFRKVNVNGTESWNLLRHLVS